MHLLLLSIALCMYFETSLAALNCGMRENRLRGVGGQDSKAGDWPWMVQLLRDGKHHCGAALIKDQWVLSAAHCFRDITSKTKLTAKVGEVYLNKTDPGEKEFDVVKYFLHPSFPKDNPLASDNDLAVVKLSKPVATGGRYVNTVCLPKYSDYFNNDRDCYLTGWGYTRGPQDRTILQTVKGPITSWFKCYGWWPQLEAGNICFGDGSFGACKGDSGGPLMCRRNGRFILVGVVSYGSAECTIKGKPSVFTNVGFYIRWVNSIIKKN